MKEIYEIYYLKMTEKSSEEELKKEPLAEITPNSVLQTPVRLQKMTTVNGKIIVKPISFEEAISKSARRVIVLPNGKEIHDTTSLEEKIRMFTRTDAKQKNKRNWGFENKGLIFEIDEKKYTKRKIEDDKSKSLKKFKYHG